MQALFDSLTRTPGLMRQQQLNNSDNNKNKPAISPQSANREMEQIFQSIKPINSPNNDTNDSANDNANGNAASDKNGSAKLDTFSFNPNPNTNKPNLDHAQSSSSSTSTELHSPKVLSRTATSEKGRR